MTDWEKYQQIRREAAYTGLALLVLILFWCWAGFVWPMWNWRFLACLYGRLRPVSGYGCLPLCW